MNTGRCRELLLPGARIYVQRRRGEGRKTPFALVAVEKGERLINMDSQAPNAVWAEALAAGIPVPGFGEIAAFRRETVFGESRLDFRTESALGEGVMEIKGVTLEEDGVARFPDAPTQRGTRHLRELIRAAEQGMPRRRCLSSRWRGCVGSNPMRPPIPLLPGLWRKRPPPG